MAKASLLQRIKGFLFGGGSKQTAKKPVQRTRRRRDDEEESGGSNGSVNRRELLNSLRGKETVEQKPQYKSMADATKTTSSASGLAAAIDAKSNSKPDPKEAARKASQERARKRLDEIKKERKEFNEATAHRYDVNEKGISKEEKTKRRIAQKNQAYDVNAEKFETEKHPVAESFGRGALSGVSFGASELALRNSKARKESGAEEFYQKHKNKYAEGAGEIIGSLASFGATAGATEKLATKVGGRAIERGAERLAESNLVKGAAKRSVDKAVKKGLVKEGTEELIKQVGKDKAKKVASALGTDIVQNLTTGALYDVNKASAEHKVGSSDWWKELGKSAALNAAVTGGVAGVSAARGGKRMAVEAADELGRLGKAGFVKQAPDAKVSLKRRRKTNISLPNERPASTISEADIDDALIESATTTEDFMDLFGLDRATAEILAEDKARQTSREAVQVASEASRRGIPRGNIKPLAEKLKVDELMPRQRNAQYASAPRSAERVDTSIEGLSRRLDELKAQTPQTDRERRAIETKIHDVEDRLNRTEWRKEGGADMDAMRKAYRGEYAGFDMSKSTNSHQSDVLEGKVKGKTATVVEMSPDEYMERAYRQIFKKPSKRGGAFAEIPETSEKVAQYAEAMRNGEKFPLPYLDYTNAGQEGRHRALAAKMAGIDKIPVVVIDDATNPKSIIEDVAEMTAKNANEAVSERLTASASGDSWKSRLVDGDDVNDFIEKNLANEDFAEYGRRNDVSINDIRDLWYETRMNNNPVQPKETSIEEAVAKASDALPENVRNGWFRNADSEYKPRVMEYLSNDAEARNAGLNIGYYNYKNASPDNNLSFEEWLVTPQKMYRGTHGQRGHADDLFHAFTPDRKIAESFGGDVTEITVRPIDTLGSYQTTSEQEFLVPKSIVDTEVKPKATPPEVRAETKATPPRAEGEFATVDEAMPSTDPALTAENETRAALERRVDEIAEDIPFTDENGNPVTGERLKVNKVAEDAAASESLPSGVKQVRSAYEYNNGEEPKLEDGILTSWNEAWKASKEYSASHATGNKKRMSKVAVSELNAMDSEAERELRQRLADSGELDYEAIDSHELYDKIAKQMRDDPDRWVKDMIEINEGGALDFRSTPEWQARVQYIMGTVDPSADAASEIAYTEAFKLAQNISSKGGQTLNLRRNFVHLTPMGKRDAILDDFINILGKSKGFVSNHPKLNSLGHFDKREYIRNILMEDDAIRDGVEKLVKANELDDVSEAFTELMLNVNKKNPKAGFDVLQELRYLNMLGNPKTHIRNVLGSAFFSPMRQVSNGIRSMLEKPIEQYARRVSGGTVEVTRHGGLSLVAAKEAWVKNPTTDAGKAALEAFKKNKAEILGSAKYDTVTYTGRGKTLVGKGVDRISDFNSKLLSGEDDFFRSRAYRENYIKSYNRYVKDGKPITDKVKRRIEKEALQESQIATFNEYNNFAKWLSNITSKANDANASTLARWGGRGVNAVMPFTKVPANLMKQSINYSPLGIAKGFANIKTAAKQGDADLLNRAIDELASGLTGTAVFGLGMLLGKTTDMFTTNTGKNDPAAKFKKDRGMQNYSITFKDPETGQGYSFTLDWLVPTSATFFSGIEMAKQLQSGDFNLLDIGGDWSTVMTRLAEPVMETSMLSGLHGMLETMRGGYGDDDTKSAIGILLRETVQSYASSMIPTALGQISRTAYKTDMQITGDDDWEYFWNQTKSKAGLANTKILGEPLGADTDAYGNVKGEKNSAADYVKSGLKNFLSPSNIQKVDFSEVDNAKIAEYERRVKDGESPEDLAYLFPKKQYKKTFKLAGEEVKMSNRDLSTYNQAKTTGGEEGMRYVLENIMFNRQTVDEKGKKVPADSAYTKEEKAKLMQQFKGKSMREVEEWLYDQPEFKNATDAERKKAISGLWNLTKDTKAVASQRVGEQAVIKAQGGDVNEYNFKNEVTEKKREALEPLIEAGVVTYEEAVDFARNAGKTYYTENEEGGSSATYYNKKEMIQYLIDKGYSYEKAEALFNAFKQSNAKPYSGNNLSSGRRGYRRRGYRRYGRRGGGGGKASVPKIDAKSMAAATRSAKGTKVKLTPPTPKTKVAAPKFKKYEV